MALQRRRSTASFLPCPVENAPTRTGCRGYEGNALSGLSAMGLQADADSRMIAAVIDSLGSNTYFRY